MYTPLLNHSPTSFLLTSSDPRHAIIMNATISESNRNLMIGLVTNGTDCNQNLFLEVNTAESRGGSIHNQLNRKSVFLQFYPIFVILFSHTSSLMCFIPYVFHSSI